MAALSQRMQIKQTSIQNSKHQSMVVSFFQKHNAMITVQPHYRFTNSNINTTSWDYSTSSPNVIISTKQSKVQRTTLQTISQVSMQNYCVQGLKFTSSANHQQPKKCVRQHKFRARSFKVYKSQKNLWKEGKPEFPVGIFH